MNRMDMSLEQIAQQHDSQPRGGRRRERMGRHMKESSGDVDMEAPSRRSPGGRRGGGGARGRRMGGGDAAGQQVVVVSSMAEAQRLARGSNAQIIRAPAGMTGQAPHRGGGRGGMRGRFQQDNDVFRNFSNNRRPQRRQDRGVLVKVEGLDRQITKEELSELIRDNFPENFQTAYLDYDETDRSMGTGGIYFRTQEAAEEACEFFSSKRLDGLPLCLSLAHDSRGNYSGYNAQYNDNNNNNNNNYNNRRNQPQHRGINADRW